MRSAQESVESIISTYKQLGALECEEAAFSSNKHYVGAEGDRRGKRGPQSHLPIDGRHPETYKSRLSERLDRWADIALGMLASAKGERHGILPPRRSNPEWEQRRQAVLKEKDVSPVEIAFAYGYASDVSVRELRIRNGLDPVTGRRLADDQRPIISTPGRARK